MVNEGGSHCKTRRNSATRFFETSGRALSEPHWYCSYCWRNGASNHCGKHSGFNFFDLPPQEAICRVNTRKKDIDISFSTLFSYPGGKSVAAYFGFDTQYENRITVTGAKVSMTLERVFTTPPKHWGELKIVRDGSTETFICPEADSFVEFFSAITGAIAKKKGAEFAKVLLQDAAVLDTMRHNAGVTHAD